MATPVQSATLGALIRQYRLRVGVTQEGLAERAGISPRSVSDLERDVARAHYPHTLGRLADALALDDSERSALLAARNAEITTGAADTAGPVLLPTAPTPFIGRRDELAAVRALLEREDVRLLTLSGSAGTGKTRLAVEAARQSASAYPDGVFFVDLSGSSAPSLLPAAIAAALALRGEAAESAVGLIDSLQGRHLLLVLDNFEQLMPAATAVAEIVAGCPELNLLLTSREILRLSAEHRFAVPPMDTPDPGKLPSLESAQEYDAISLFVQRARAVQPDFALTADNVGAVTGICARLAGLPLAIELAAARTRHFSPQALLTRLDDPLRLLTAGARDAPERQQTLRAAITWSYSLLTAGEQALLRRLSIFSSGFTLEAAAGICDPDGELDALEGVASLVDKSLVQRVQSDEPRFALLPMLREFAGEQLAARGEQEELRRRHAEWFVRWLEHGEALIWTREQRAYLRRVDDEYDNLLSALEWAEEHGEAETGLRLIAAVAMAWQYTLRETQCSKWGARLLALGGEVTPRTRARTLWFATDFVSSGPKQMQERMEKSIAQARVAGDQATLQTLLSGWAAAYAFWARDAAVAEPLLAEATILTCRLGDRRWIAANLRTAAKVAELRGDAYRAAELLHECLTLERAAGNVQGIAFCLHSLGWIQRQRNVRAAHTTFKEALAYYRQAGDRGSLDEVYSQLTETSLALGDHATASRLVNDRMRLAETAGEEFLTPFALRDIGYLELVAGDLVSAERHLDRGLEQSDGFVWGSWKMCLLGNLRIVVVLTGRWERATALADQMAYEARHTVDHDPGGSWSLTAPAVTRWQHDASEVAIAEIDELLRHAEQEDDATLAAGASRDLAAIELIRSNPEAAREHAARALMHLERVDMGNWQSSPHPLEAKQLLLEAVIDLGNLGEAQALADDLLAGPAFRLGWAVAGVQDHDADPTAGKMIPPVELHRLRGKLHTAQRHWKEAAASFEMALAAARGLSERSLVLGDYARMHAAKGETGKARSKLVEARALAVEIGAQPLVRRAERLLASV